MGPICVYFAVQPGPSTPPGSTLELRGESRYQQGLRWPEGCHGLCLVSSWEGPVGSVPRGCCCRTLKWGCQGVLPLPRVPVSSVPCLDARRWPSVGRREMEKLSSQGTVRSLE